MTDWFEMVEGIQNAMKAVGKAHVATEQLRQQANGQTVKQFHDEMVELAGQLARLQQILAHNPEFTMDEIAEAVGRNLGTAHTYHRYGSVEPK